jgi:nucleoside-diphosphate-sugar epimerase
MMVLVTGSSGHLGEALMRVLPGAGHRVVGADSRPGSFTDRVGTIADRGFVRGCMTGVDAVVHAATLHKPHVATHSRQAFVDANISGTLNLLEEAVAAAVRAFVYTSTTSVFGRALHPAAGAPAAWITEDVVPVPKNIYGVTKLAAEQLCDLFHRSRGLPCLILRTSRFFPEADDNRGIRESYDDGNAKLNELLYRRVDVEDAVSAHLAALDKAAAIGFGRYIVSATTPFARTDVQELHTNAAAVLKRRVPEFERLYRERNWTMFPTIDRVYVNDLARHDLDWTPRYDFRRVLEALGRGEDPRSPLARAIGSKGYHAEAFSDGPYPVE